MSEYGLFDEEDPSSRRRCAAATAALVLLRDSQGITGFPARLHEIITGDSHAPHAHLLDTSPSVARP